MVVFPAMGIFGFFGGVAGRMVGCVLPTRVAGRAADVVTPEPPPMRPVVPGPVLPVMVQLVRSTGYQQTDADLRFEERVRDRCNYVIERMFYAHIAGVTFPNANGSKRLPAIRKCRVGEVLVLLHDDSIPGHPTAVGIFRDDGSQVGYLDARLAGETRRDGIYKYVCVFRRKLYKPETKTVAGAIICMARMKEKDAVE